MTNMFDYVPASRLIRFTKINSSPPYMLVIVHDMIKVIHLLKLDKADSGYQ
jgi:hypothetical protein